MDSDTLRKYAAYHTWKRLVKSSRDPAVVNRLSGVMENELPKLTPAEQAKVLEDVFGVKTTTPRGSSTPVSTSTATLGGAGLGGALGAGLGINRRLDIGGGNPLIPGLPGVMTDAGIGSVLGGATGYLADKARRKLRMNAVKKKLEQAQSQRV